MELGLLPMELLIMELDIMELDIMELLTMELTTYQLDMEQAMEHPSPLWGVDLDMATDMGMDMATSATSRSREKQ